MNINIILHKTLKTVYMFLKDKELPIETRIFRIFLIIAAIALIGICIMGLLKNQNAFIVASWYMAIISVSVALKTLLNIIFDFYNKFHQ